MSRQPLMSAQRARFFIGDFIAGVKTETCDASAAAVGSGESAVVGFSSPWPAGKRDWIPCDETLTHLETDGVRQSELPSIDGPQAGHRPAEIRAIDVVDRR